MLAPRTAVTAIALALALGGAACGGGGDDGGIADGSTTSIVDGATTTTGATDDTEPGPDASDIDACGLLTADELEAQASVANVATFEVTSQEPRPPDSRGVVHCDNYFTVIEESGEITAVLAVEVATKDAANQYDLARSVSDDDAEDVDGFGDKAFWTDENTRLVILVDSLLLTIDVGMPGIMEETNRPVAEAVAPIILDRL